MIPKGKISQVQFGLLSDEEIERRAVMEVTEPACLMKRGALYDLRLGSPDRQHNCNTCFQTFDKCSGHFGFFRLNTPVIMFPSLALHFLKCMCFVCGRLLKNKASLKVSKLTDGYIGAHADASAMSTCMHCQEPRPQKLTFNALKNVFEATYKCRNEAGLVITMDVPMVESIFKRASPEHVSEDMRLLNLDPSMFQPKSLVHRLFPVLPNQCRPRVFAQDMESDAEITLIYKQMLEKARDLASETNPEKRKTIENILMTRAIAFVDNNKVKNTSLFFKQYESVASFLNSSDNREAKGFIRFKIQGKRTNFNARSVITPDCSLRINEVKIPQNVAKQVTRPEIVTKHNIEQLQAVLDAQLTPQHANLPFRITVVEEGPQRQFVTRSFDNFLLPSDVIIDGETLEPRIGPFRQGIDVVYRYGKPLPKTVFQRKLKIGFVVYRTLRDGDMVLFNRQPTLHRASMQSLRVVLHKDPNIKTFSFHPHLLKGWNADFDGDEMNLFIAQCLEALAEQHVLMAMANKFCSFQSEKTEFPLIQDSLLGAHLMSKRDIDRHDAMQLFMAAHPLGGETLDFAETFPNQRDRASRLFSSVFPPLFEYHFQGVDICRGVMTPESVLTKAHLGSGAMSIQRIIFLDHGAEDAIFFVDRVAAMCIEYLTMFPATIGIEDCFSLDTRAEEQKSVEEMEACISNCFSPHQFRSHERGVTEAEREIDNVMVSYKNRCSLKLESIKKAGKTTNFDQFIESGSKGDPFNLDQIFLGLGKQHLMFGMTKIDGGQRPLIYFPRVCTDLRDKLISMGFVFSSFFSSATPEKPYTGMTPVEMIFHAKSGREGVVCKAVKTAQTGYNHRRTLKQMENVKVTYTDMLVNGSNRILQFSAGFALDKVSLCDGIYEPVNVPRLAARVNILTPGPQVPIEMDALVERALPESPHVPGPLRHILERDNRARLVSLLQKVTVSDPQLFGDMLVERYHRARIDPGEPVGFNTANSIGESKTQTNLNLFHKSGAQHSNETDMHPSFEQLIEMTKSNVNAVYTIHFRQTISTLTQLRDMVGVEKGKPIAQIILRDLISSWRREGRTIRMTLNRKACFLRRVTPGDLVQCLVDHFVMEDVCVVLSDAKDELVVTTNILPNFDLVVGGIPGLVQWEPLQDKVTGDYYAMAVGDISFHKIFAQILAHPLVLPGKTVCNHAAIVFGTLGLLECRKTLLREFSFALPSIFPSHIQTIVDVMTQMGQPKNFTRYSIRSLGEGPSSHASFEEPMKAFMDAMTNTTVDPLTSVSACVMWAKPAPIGTGMVHLRAMPVIEEEQVPEWARVDY